MEGKYSLIIMTDSGKTMRWRLSPTMLRSLVVVLVLLPLLAAGSLWLNWKLFTDRRAVLAENTVLRHDVDANAQTVARLSGLERFLLQNAPDSLGDLVAVAPDPAPSAGNTASGVSTIDSAAPAPATSTPTEERALSGTASSTNITVAPVAPSESASPTVVDPSPVDPSPVDGAAPNKATPQVKETLDNSNEETPSPGFVAPPSANAVDPLSADGVVDKGFARIENLTVRRAGSRSLRVSFDLFNAEQVQQLSGKTTFELVTNEGKIYPLDAHGDTTFRINRLKKIVGNPILPADVTNLAGASIRVSIFTGDDLIYRVATPIN